MTIPNWDTLCEYDQILVPIAGDQYHAYSLLDLLYSQNLLSAIGMGLAPLHFITQRGPYQDGSTPLDMRWDVRTIQIAVNSFFVNRTRLTDRRWELVDLLRPNRSFDDEVRPLIYRKWLPGGGWVHGTDLETSISTTATSHLGKFIHNGLRPGCYFQITSGADAGTHVVSDVPNDYSVVFGAALTAAATNIHYRYKRAQSYRDLYCMLEAGPAFDLAADNAHYPAGYTEVLRFVAHDPFWYGQEQEEAWTIPSDQGDLVFDGLGAWLGITPGVGRWLFAQSYVGENVSIVYWGHEVAFPTIELAGPMIDPIITNTTTNVSLSLNYTIAAGETVEIDTQNLSMQNNFGTNLFPYLTGDIATFSIQPEPQAPNRINDINISYSGGTLASAARLTWKNKYAAL